MHRVFSGEMISMVASCFNDSCFGQTWNMRHGKEGPVCLDSVVAVAFKK